MRFSIRWTACAALSLALCLCACDSVEPGTLVGTVRDASRTQISGAIVTVVSQDKSISVGARTSTSGDYVTPRLRAGDYLVVVQKEGFQDARSSVSIHPAETLRLDCQLKARSPGSDVPGGQ